MTVIFLILVTVVRLCVFRLWIMFMFCEIKFLFYWNFSLIKFHLFVKFQFNCNFVKKNGIFMNHIAQEKRLPKKLTKRELCVALGFTFYGSERCNYTALFEKVLPPQYCEQNNIRVGRHREYDLLETERIFERLKELGYKIEKLF